MSRLSLPKSLPSIPERTRLQLAFAGLGVMAALLVWVVYAGLTAPRALPFEYGSVTIELPPALPYVPPAGAGGPVAEERPQPVAVASASVDRDVPRQEQERRGRSEVRTAVAAAESRPAAAAPPPAPPARRIVNVEARPASVDFAIPARPAPVRVQPAPAEPESAAAPEPEREPALSERAAEVRDVVRSARPQ